MNRESWDGIEGCVHWSRLASIESVIEVPFFGGRFAGRYLPPQDGYWVNIQKIMGNNPRKFLLTPLHYSDSNE